MSSIASLGRMVSGLKASQLGLQVTGHNLSNLNTKGYTRQQLLQHESGYLNIGVNGGNLQQVGLGVSISEIRQVRDAFVDKRFRTEQSVLTFYTTKQDATREIEAILDEPHGESISGMMEDFWKQAQKLSTNPSGVEERLAFIQTADVLIKRANQIMDGFETYQHHLNTQVKQTVTRINQITKDIKDLNDQIARSEVNGDNANDYRDMRNLLLDELSGYMDITYSENPDGRIEVKANGRHLVDGQFVTELDLQVLDNGSGFVTPVWKDTKDPVFNMNNEVNSTNANDQGKLQALLITRGNQVASADTSWKDIAINQNKSVDYDGNAYLLPKVQKEFAQMIERMTEMVNEVLSGNGIDGSNGVMVFVPVMSGAGPELTQSKFENMCKASGKILIDLPTPMIGKGNEGKVEYIETLDSYEKMLDDYKAFIEADPSDPDYATKKAAYEASGTAYQTSVEKYKKAIKGAELKEDATLVSTSGKTAANLDERFEQEVGILFAGSEMQVNPELLGEGGYNHLGTVAGNSGDIGDNSLVTKLLDEWNKPQDWAEDLQAHATNPKYKDSNFMDYYAEFVTEIGTEGFKYQGKVSEKNTLVLNATNERLAMGGVSQDEELTNMLKYQYAYNASSRMINVLDGMMDTVINRM